MSFGLANSPKVPYSTNEKRLFRFLQAQPQTTTRLAERFYGKDAVPLNGRVIIRVTASNLDAKSKLNGEPWRVKKTARCGPHPIKYWLDLKKVR